MDIQVQEDIELEAQQLYSPNSVTINNEITLIREKLNTEGLNVNDAAKLYHNLENAMKHHNMIRMQQSTKKQAILTKLYIRYPSVDSREIQQALELAVNKLYESKPAP
jgi:hypothetical protein